MSTKPTIPNWSFSRLAIFEQCAYRAKLQSIDKIPDNTPKTAADRGTLIHTEAENYVKGDGPLHPSLAKFQTDFESLRRHYADGRVFLEGEWGFDSEWNRTTWAKAWLRLKCDAVVALGDNTLAVIDFKTGTRFGNEVKHLDQLHLYAVSSFLRYPSIKKVITEDWYLDHNEKASHTITDKQMPKHLALFDKRGHKMTSTTVFKPNPNQFTCKWCPYGPDKQGDCKYGVSASAAPPKRVVSIVNKASATDNLF
jgi:hypothetical protein